MREPKRGDTASRGSRSSDASIQLFMAVDAGPFEFLWRPLPWKQDGFRGPNHTLPLVPHRSRITVWARVDIGRFDAACVNREDHQRPNSYHFFAFQACS